MPAKPTIKIGDIFSSKSFGDVEVIEYKSVKEVTVQFIDTGFILQTNASNLRKGELKDKLKPSVFGVGKIGYKGVCKEDGKKLKSYALWHNILLRCYYPSSKQYKDYGGSGVFVCERWLTLENFQEDIKLLPGYAEWLVNDGWSCDKDLMSPFLQKCYSPQTCCFVPSSVNTLESVIRRERNKHKGEEA